MVRVFSFGLLAFLITLSGCSFIASKTTGDQPIGTQKSGRSFGRYVDDKLIETYVGANILKADAGFKSAHIGVNSYNGIVLLTGQVKSEKLKEIAARSAKQVRNVRRVHNEIAIAGPISIPARTNDGWLKTKIKSRMLVTKGANPVKIKVVVEDGAVYLMGKVTQAQARQAVDIAHKTYGVQKIVKVFEYLD